MKKLTILFILAIFTLSGCGQSGEKAIKPAAFLETVEVDVSEPLVYLPVSAADASSFDQTPDWAPEPDPMASVDGDMLTRWSSNYLSEEEWIYFDLGGECVVNNVIIRWERAHAIKYKIMASKDADTWQEVYNETAGIGGTMEAAFTPVKCRYIKIQGLAKANEDWGISIWEVEIYGPGKQNPHATKTKEACLSKSEDASERKEADELLDKMAAPIPSISERPFQKGAVYTSWMADELSMPVSDMTLAYLKETGFDTISIMVPAYQEKIDSKVIFTNDKPNGDTPTDEALEHAVKSCHKLGLRVMIKPHVDPRTDEARINIMPSEEWFDSYEKFILRYAQFSQENNVELFSVGTELEATSFEGWSHRWNDVIDKIKGVYTGKLTYSANWTEYEEVPFWDKLDLIGLDAYFPLSETDEVSLEELIATWEGIADKIETWLTEKGLTGKGVILTEIGYPSAKGAARQPWVAISNIEDQKAQADCLEATFAVLKKRPWFEGYYIW
ncbi:MAG: discoidin domain-containing protein, partial [Candidatus Omnitrophica bacterium]|nr:discoidin domain-containing protein [Candidatus Omnitrophota bacterium]